MSGAVLVATREGVLAYAFTFLAIGLGVGFALGLLIRRRPAEPRVSDRPEDLRFRGIRAGTRGW